MKFRTAIETINNAAAEGYDLNTRREVRLERIKALLQLAMWLRTQVKAPEKAPLLGHFWRGHHYLPAWLEGYKHLMEAVNKALCGEFGDLKAYTLHGLGDSSKRVNKSFNRDDAQHCSDCGEPYTRWPSGAYTCTTEDCATAQKASNQR